LQAGYLERSANSRKGLERGLDMPFQLARCSAELLEQLGIPNLDSEKDVLNPFPLPIVYDESERIALIAGLEDHSTRPYYGYMLWINGRFVRVWDAGASQQVKARRVDVYITDTTQDLTDEWLQSTVGQALAVLFKVEEWPFEVAIRGRKLPKKPARPPSKVIAGLNKAVAMIGDYGTF
jgi:hypothetical protein